MYTDEEGLLNAMYFVQDVFCESFHPSSSQDQRLFSFMMQVSFDKIFFI